MLVVKVELHSAIDGSTQELGRMVIANDGTGTRTIGNYDVVAFKKGCSGHSRSQMVSGLLSWINRGKRTEGVIRGGRADGYQRVSKPVWCLVAKALEGMGYG